MSMKLAPPRGRTERRSRPVRADEAGAPIALASNEERDGVPREGEEKFRAAVESCPNGMIMSDADGHIVMVNSEVERLFGYRREELIGASVDILVPERLRGQHLHHRRGFVRTPEKRQMSGHRDLMGRRRDGSEFPVEVGLNPIRTREGAMVLSAIVDISERKRLERLKDEFVAMVSHELRTPLTSIAGSLGLLMGNAAGNLPDTAVRLLSIAHANSQRLVRLINDILDLQKIEAGQVVFHLKYLDLRPLLEQTLEANRAFAHEFGVRIRLDEACDDGEVFADSDRLAQVVTNLLSNAIKFSPKGSEVTIGIDWRGDNLRVWVRDRGPGIPDDFKPRVFEKFAQADSSNARQKGGSGLGLSIVKQLIHQHGGRVGFEDMAGGGTVFYFELPNVPKPARGTCSAHAGAGSPILLCENDTATSGLLAEALHRVGFAVEAVSTAAGAQTHAPDTPYAALLIDLALPDLDGISLVRQLRALPRHAATPVIFFALNPEPSARLQFGLLSVCDWLAKPADRGQLLRTIHRAIAETGLARPRVLHVEPDDALRHLVHEALRAHAEITSVDSIEDAQHALAALCHDLAVFDLTDVDDAALGLLATLADHNGHALPALVFSTAPGPQLVEHVRSVLAASRMSLDRMVGTVRLVLAKHGKPADASTEVA
jgi:PAS domain S-box-containing protein